MRKKQLFCITILSVMLSMTLIGSVLLSQVAARERSATITFKPDKYTWGDPPTDPWKVSISVGWFYTYRIIGDTIRLEDTVAPESWRSYWFFGFYAYFDGNDVKEVIGAKLGHEGMVPGTHYVVLTVTGDLRYGDTFRGTDTITVTVPEYNPP